MTRNISLTAFVLGLVIVVWIGIGYIGTNPLALLMTVTIGAVYAVGAVEMRGFRQATSTLSRALAAIPDDLPHLGSWLDQLHPSLRNPVRLRIEGERSSLPGPALTPYLLGLLVMLGMLGTFIGMVLTLNGAVFALEGQTDPQTMRSSLSAPIRGLGLAFGTSVAGVATSALLGLIAALGRRERLQVAQLLDTRIATVLRSFSLTHQRQEAFTALQAQAQVLPLLVDRLQAMMAAMERQHQHLGERLAANQEGFHSDVRSAYAELASAVDQSLKASLTEGARAAGETIKPLVEATMQGLAREAQSLHEAITETFAERSASLLARLQADQSLRDEQRLAALTQAMESMATGLQREWQQAGEQTLARQQQLCATIERTARDITAQARTDAERTFGEVGRLVEAAAAAPRAAAEVIARLREEIAIGTARDNELLEERRRLMETMNTLLAGLNQGTVEQRAAIGSLVTASTALVDQVNDQFTARIQAESLKLAEAAAQVTGSAVEVSSLSDAFAGAVGKFGDSSERMIASLQRIEASLDKSTARSDDQLAYYVAQARELIDLSIMSQQQIVADLQRHSGKPASLATGVS